MDENIIDKSALVQSADDLYQIEENPSRIIAQHNSNPFKALRRQNANDRLEVELELLKDVDAQSELSAAPSSNLSNQKRNSDLDVAAMMSSLTLSEGIVGLSVEESESDKSHHLSQTSSAECDALSQFSNLNGMDESYSRLYCARVLQNVKNDIFAKKSITSKHSTKTQSFYQKDINTIDNLDCFKKKTPKIFKDKMRSPKYVKSADSHKKEISNFLEQQQLVSLSWDLKQEKFRHGLLGTQKLQADRKKEKYENDSRFLEPSQFRFLPKKTFEEKSEIERRGSSHEIVKKRGSQHDLMMEISQD